MNKLFCRLGASINESSQYLIDGKIESYTASELQCFAAKLMSASKGKIIFARHREGDNTSKSFIFFLNKGYAVIGGSGESSLDPGKVYTYFFVSREKRLSSLIAGLECYAKSMNVCINPSDIISIQKFYKRVNIAISLCLLLILCLALF